MGSQTYINSKLEVMNKYSCRNLKEEEIQLSVDFTNTPEVVQIIKGKISEIIKHIEQYLNSFFEFHSLSLIIIIDFEKIFYYKDNSENNIQIKLIDYGRTELNDQKILDNLNIINNPNKDVTDSLNNLLKIF